MAQFLCRFQQVDVNSRLGYKNLTLKSRVLPFKSNNLTPLLSYSVKSHNQTLTSASYPPTIEFLKPGPKRIFET